MATYTYTDLGSIPSSQPGVRKRMLLGHILLDTGDTYLRATGLLFTFPQITNILHIIGLYSDVVANLCQIIALRSFATNILTVSLMESGPGSAGPLREKTDSEVHDQNFNVYAVVIGL